MDTLQSEPIARTAPAARNERNGYCQRQRSPMNGMVRHVHLGFAGRPERLGIGGHIERAEARDVVGMDDLDVRDVRSRVRRAVGPPRRLDRVERLANRPVADGMEVRLESEGIEARDPFEQALRIDLGQPAIPGRVPVAVEIRTRASSAVKFSTTPSIISLTLVGR